MDKWMRYKKCLGCGRRKCSCEGGGVEVSLGANGEITISISDGGGESHAVYLYMEDWLALRAWVETLTSRKPESIKSRPF
jgi:hypothetical protein